MSDYRDEIRENVTDIRQRICIAAEKSGRTASDVRLIAVTKTIAPQRIEEVVEAGVLDLGENRVQELLEKYDIINKACHWHLIGHLQTNKVKYIIDKAAMIHSVDRMELVQEIQTRAAKINKVMDILVQVNVSGEESKFGMTPEAVPEFMKRMQAYPNVKVRGLMTIAPYTEQPEEIRFVFRGLKKIFIDIKKENIDNIDMEYLSMGMSNDFEIAIEEGANLVRIGTALFGKRQYGNTN